MLRKRSRRGEFQLLESRTVLSTTPVGNFVQALFQDVMHRSPDGTGFFVWAEATGDPADAQRREQTAAGMFASRECLLDQATRDYQTYLGRAPDPEGLDHWMGLLESGQRREEFLAGICSSDEYLARHGAGTEGFVQGLYQDLLGRAADSGGLAHWVSRAASSRQEAVDGLLQSPERHERSIAEWYQRYLGRAVDAEGLNHWRDRLTDGATERDVQTAITACAEYLERARFSGDAVLDWNVTLFDALFADRTLPGPTWASRSMAMVHGAVFDAVNSIDGSYTPYLVNVAAPAGASAEAAAAAAAHRVLSALYPAQTALFDARLAASLAEIPDGASKTDGVAVGVAAADAMLAARAADGSSADITYQPTADAGHWQPDPLNPGQKALTPGWGFVAPFALASGDQFPAPAPPALDSPEYAAAFNEVKSLGELNSATRTPEQTEIGVFWGYDRPGLGTPPVLYNQIAQAAAMSRGGSLVAHARLLALVNIAMADAGISCWHAKYLNDFWRPVTAVRNADADGNPLTEADPNWTPLGAPGGGTILDFTPPFPAYISGHATFGAAAMQVLSDFFGSDEFHFSIGSDEMPGVYRSFERFSDASAENGRSRIYLGIHWNFDDSQGRANGIQVADYIYDRVATPV